MTAYPIIDSAQRSNSLDLSAALTTPGGTTGDTFTPGGDIYLRLKTTGTAITATITNSGLDPYGVGKAALTIAAGALPATGDGIYGPFPAAEFADPADGQVHIAYTVVTGLTVGVYRITNG
jgi:hypothetical protein